MILWKLSRTEGLCKKIYEKILHHILKINKKNFKCVIKGEGPLVILVHGWPETLVSKNQISFIQNLGFSSFAFNTRGYGGSHSPQRIKDYGLKYFCGGYSRYN